MYIYNNRGIMITGPVTDSENNPNNTWTSIPFKGDTINIKIKLPTNLKNNLKLKISMLGYGVKGVFSDDGTFAGGFGTSAACEINIACPLGNNWGNQEHAVAKVIGDQGTDLFTGAVMMNTCNTNIPYFLTAWHCLDNYVGSWQFIFQYWSPTCTPTQNTTNILQFNGASNVASNPATDFALVQLSQTPAANSNISYLGWNRNANAATNTIGIHQPAGDVMKISSDANPPVLTNWTTAPFFNNANDWWMAHFQQGTVEPGSSGSPLFDQNQRVVGQLSGNPNTQGNYCAEQIGDYGRFDLSWTGGDTNATRLSNWLDPSNSGVLTTNTTNVANLSNNITITGPLTVCASSQAYSVNLTTPVSWTSSNTAVATVPSSGNPVTVTKVSNGQINLTATATGCGVQYTTSQIITMGTPPIPTIYASRVGGSCYYDAAVDLLSGAQTTVQFSLDNSTWTAGTRSGANTYTGGYEFLGVSHQLVYARTNNTCGNGTVKSVNLYIPAPPQNCAYIATKIGAENLKNKANLDAKIFKIQEIKVYPNPANNNLIIELPETSKDAWMNVINGEGKTMFTRKLSSTKSVVNISSLHTGLYLIELRVNGQIKSTKILKQ